MTSLELLDAVESVLVGVAAATTAIVAVLGLKSWRRELKGRAEFEVARALIRATYKLRDDLAQCRSPFLSGREFPEGHFAHGREKTPEIEAAAYAHVYKNRWAPVWTALQEFDSHTLEAEALWGSDIRARTESLRRCVAKLNAAIDALIADKASGGEDFKADKEFGKEVRREVSATGRGDENPLSREIKDAVAGIEGQIRPHLKRS